MTRIYAPTEAEFMALVIDCAHLNRWVVWHDFDSRRNPPGLPDLILMRPPEPLLFIELKTDTGKLRPDQTRWLTSLKACGADARVWRPADYDDEILPTLSKRRAS